MTTDSKSLPEAEASEEWQTRAAAVADPEREPALMARELLAEMYAHARECYPEECCGLIVGGSEEESLRVVRCTNVQSVRHANGESELDAKRGFWIDLNELESALRVAEERGESLRMVYHSHTDTEAYLSRTDLAGALGPDGQPLWPQAEQLVISVREGAVQSAALFAWDAKQEAYIGRSVREG